MVVGDGIPTPLGNILFVRTPRTCNSCRLGEGRIWAGRPAGRGREAGTVSPPAA